MGTVLRSIGFADWVSEGYGSVLLIVLLLAGLGTAVLFFVGLVAYFQRRSTQYRLVAIALGALVGRTLVGWGTIFGVVPMMSHHLVEHSLDFAIAVLLLYTAYRSGSTREINT